MFCPKCGSQNADETKFCRGCGADLGNVLAALDTVGTSLIGISGKKPHAHRGGSDPDGGFAEKHIDLFSSGIRGVITGAGFFITSGLAFLISMRLSVLGISLLAFASYFLGTGISRLIQAKGIKALSKRDEPAELPHPQADYLKPSRSIYQTDDLIANPLSVTEHTTTHLQMDTDGETPALAKK
jgi:hypothetical protein